MLTSLWNYLKFEFCAGWGVETAGNKLYSDPFSISLCWCQERICQQLQQALTPCYYTSVQGASARAFYVFIYKVLDISVTSKTWSFVLGSSLCKSVTPLSFFGMSQNWSLPVGQEQWKGHRKWSHSTAGNKLDLYEILFWPLWCYFSAVSN